MEYNHFDSHCKKNRGDNVSNRNIDTKNQRKGFKCMWTPNIWFAR